MAREPQGPLSPLRLQADYKRLRDEQRALLARVQAGDKGAADALSDKDREIIAYVQAYKKGLR